MNDPADNAAEREETDRNLALEAMKSRQQEKESSERNYR